MFVFLNYSSPVSRNQVFVHASLTGDMVTVCFPYSVMAQASLEAAGFSRVSGQNLYHKMVNRLSRMPKAERNRLLQQEAARLISITAGFILDEAKYGEIDPKKEMQALKTALQRRYPALLPVLDLSYVPVTFTLERTCCSTLDRDGLHVEIDQATGQVTWRLTGEAPILKIESISKINVQPLERKEGLYTLTIHGQGSLHPFCRLSRFTYTLLS